MKRLNHVAVNRGMRRHQGGFTLIEILIVVVLISVATSMAVVRINRNQDKIAHLEAKKFRGLVEFLREESVVTGKLLGVRVDVNEGKYHFVRHSGSWEKVEDDQTLREYEFPEDIKARFDVRRTQSQSRKKKKRKNIPAGVVMVEPVGTITPFTLTLGGDTQNWKVLVDEDQNVMIKSEDK